MSAAIKHGFEPVLRDLDKIIANLDLTSTTAVYSVSCLPLPSSPLAKAVQSFAKAQLSPETYNHSMRVYYIGETVLLTHFREAWPSLVNDPTAYFCSCLLHDIGTTDANITATKMSFEYYGGLLARKLVVEENGGDPEMGDSIAETIIRHQDVGKRGYLSANTQLIQIATLFDNMGEHLQLVANETRDDIYNTFPRGQWSSCFASVIHRECGLKPYCSTTKLGEEAFSSGVLANTLNKLEK
jgi:cyanamide hydratase